MPCWSARLLLEETRQANITIIGITLVVNGLATQNDHRNFTLRNDSTILIMLFVSYREYDADLGERGKDSRHVVLATSLSANLKPNFS